MTQADRILNTIKTNGSMTSREMVEAGIFKYTSRISELRKRGHNIVAHRVKDSLFSYTIEEGRKMTADEANEFLRSLRTSNEYTLDQYSLEL